MKALTNLTIFGGVMSAEQKNNQTQKSALTGDLIVIIVTIVIIEHYESQKNICSSLAPSGELVP